jgi:hypothetical protein
MNFWREAFPPGASGGDWFKAQGGSGEVANTQHPPGLLLADAALIAEGEFLWTHLSTHPQTFR